ncbi:pseudouridylate synthase [Podospora australis]|uniref:Pseudouridylate synthase n=1 Tax=Podospora australis TaxID=1536484 RepID=A0AAN7AL03_9PEZI|nr:pseudouridylate synthase [Podospora australis]
MNVPSYISKSFSQAPAHSFLVPLFLSRSRPFLSYTSHSHIHSWSRYTRYPTITDNANMSSSNERTTPNYKNWTKDRLVEKVKELEQELKRHKPIEPPAPEPLPLPPVEGQDGTVTLVEGKKPKKQKKMDPSRYSTRLVALKLAYLGKNYGGFEFQAVSGTPTIEEELWKALTKGCLIFPEDPNEVDFSKWEYSKCGRTDRGVSAFGQVICLRLRSNRPLPVDPSTITDQDTDMTDTNQPQKKKKVPKPDWDPIADEINYPKILNRLLPPDIRVLAWAPNLPDGFSARFSCWERQYRYFFTQPAYAPVLASSSSSDGKDSGWLNIEAMRTAAKLYEGLHDFRNFCKVDGCKQITNFKRRIFEADIVEVPDVGSSLPFLSSSHFSSPSSSGTQPKVYYFHVRGSAFLWHQIRHMVSVLFAIGQNLESPSVISDLLDVTKFPQRPTYPMADEVPLVLWDCIFPNSDNRIEADSPDYPVNLRLKDGVDWVWLGEDLPQNLHGPGGVADQMWEYWRERKMDELLANQLLQSIASRPDLSKQRGRPEPASRRGGGQKAQRVYEGGNFARPTGVYVPLLKKPLMPTPQEVNDRWAQVRGFKDAEELANTKNWREKAKAFKADKAAAVAAEKEAALPAKQEKEQNNAAAASG